MTRMTLKNVLEFIVLDEQPLTGIENEGFHYLFEHMELNLVFYHKNIHESVQNTHRNG